MITIIDYGAGNLSSVSNAVRSLGTDTLVTADADKILKADKIIFPGVGAFPECKRMLDSSGITQAVVQAIKVGTPTLCICIGMQMLFDYSTEFGNTKGLGLVSGGVNKIRSGQNKLPHIAWTSIKKQKDSKILDGIADDEYFYFVHSFCAKAENKNDIVATSEYGEEFTSAVELDNLFGTQFHPEKSGKAGLKVL